MSLGEGCLGFCFLRRHGGELLVEGEHLVQLLVLLAAFSYISWKIYLI